MDDLASLELGGLKIIGVPLCYEDSNLERIGALAPSVLVGVDDIPSRWAVQRARPVWLGVGATSHYSAMASFHSAGLACAICLHPRTEEDSRPIPTAAFVSHWAGVWLACMFVRYAAGQPLSPDEQQTYATMLRPDSDGAIWRSRVQPRMGCPIPCPL